jgi:hypothetical protein
MGDGYPDALGGGGEEVLERVDIPRILGDEGVLQQLHGRRSAAGPANNQEFEQ